MKRGGKKYVKNNLTYSANLTIFVYIMPMFSIRCTNYDKVNKNRTLKAEWRSESEWKQKS